MKIAPVYYLKMRTKNFGLALVPASHPAPGDVVLFCIHRPDVRKPHFFYLPGATGDGGWCFRRPDGTPGGPARWLAMCRACFMVYGSAPECPFASDMPWSEDLRVEFPTD